MQRAPSEPAAVQASLARLKRLLETDDGEVADALAEAKAGLVSVLTPIEMKTLTKRIDDFDFEAALECLSGIGSRLSLNLDAN